MSKEDAIPDGFRKPIHSDDLPKIMNKWALSRDSGNLCVAEIRYRQHNGVYKWMLVRAVPLRDKYSGKSLKWYGTNTDIHDLVIQRIEAARNKMQNLTVLAHAEISLFVINKDRTLVLLEGGSEMNERIQIDKSALLGQDYIKTCKITQPGGLPGMFQVLRASTSSNCTDLEHKVMDILEGRVRMTDD